VLVDDLDAQTDCTLSKFAGDYKLEGMINAPDVSTAIQTDLSR